MIHFRRPDQHVGFIMMCQLFIAFGSTLVTQTTTLSTMAGKESGHLWGGVMVKQSHSN